ncbi:response regulator [Echinicola jeungdonensis]|uniref:Response regulator n=1 Tax=Echinicola jeungdonensis TaxID=709343 RepID=A0ABV5J6J4_9BACT|nr:hybrid sensor histidine kinase/response regulator [Echinicola jeungdonensis]MDN3670080.1 response regulator [Echinicola jeungdonensis]
MINKKVLIVDDNDLNRKVFENIIRHNYQFDSAENGKEAINKIKKSSFDLILMDIQMPEMDGITALKVIKEEKLTDSPIIAVSAYSHQNDREYFLATGFDDFIPKPVKPKELLNCIYHQFRNHENIQNQPEELDENFILDEKVLNQLKKYNSRENISTVYEDFIKEAQDLTDEIKLLIERKQFLDIGQKLHILKGNAGTLGAMRLFFHASHFESKIKAAKFEEILEDYITLQKQINTFRDFLNNTII